MEEKSIQNIFNALEAIMAATALFGVYEAVLLRILANTFATLYCVGFHAVWERTRERIIGKEMRVLK